MQIAHAFRFLCIWNTFFSLHTVTKQQGARIKNREPFSFSFHFVLYVARVAQCHHPDILLDDSDDDPCASTRVWRVPGFLILWPLSADNEKPKKNCRTIKRNNASRAAQRTTDLAAVRNLSNTQQTTNCAAAFVVQLYTKKGTHSAIPFWINTHRRLCANACALPERGV